MSAARNRGEPRHAGAAGSQARRIAIGLAAAVKRAGARSISEQRPPPGSSGASKMPRFAAALLAAALALLLAATNDGRATETPPATALAADAGEARVGYLRVEGAIDRLRSRYLARALAEARGAGLDALVVHLDTDGGEVHYAREMFRAIMVPRRAEPFASRSGETPARDGAADPLRSNGPSGGHEGEGAQGGGPRMIAFIDFRALSAGALIAYAHHEIFLTEEASIGDIGVIYRGPEGTIEYAPEKVETVVRTLLAQAAEQRGWPRGPLLKMTARNQNLYRITPPGGEPIYVIEDDFAAWLADHPEVDREDTDQVIVYRGHDRLLTLTGREAVSLGMATGTVTDLAAVYARLGVDPAQVVDLRPTSAERTATWLAGIAPLLMGLAVLLLIFEIKTPGVGLWALLGAVSGGLFLFAHYYLDLVTHFEVVLLILGLGLIATELLLLPAGGFLAIPGGICLFAGAVLAFLPNEIDLAPGDPHFREALFDAALQGGIALAVVALGFLLFFQLVPNASRLRSRLTVEAEITATSGSGGDFLVGRIGQVEGALRPAGTVRIGRTHYSARSEYGAWIAAGEPVEVVAAELGEVVVRAAARPPDADDDQ